MFLLFSIIWYECKSFFFKLTSHLYVSTALALYRKKNYSITLEQKYGHQTLKY